MYATDFRQAADLEEARLILTDATTPWRILAGGTDLLIEMRDANRGDPADVRFLDITRINGLRDIRKSNGELHLGTLVTFSDLICSELVRCEFPILADMACQMGSVQIRNRATIGGNLVNANPCADSAPPLMALDARITLENYGGQRSIPLRSFILGSGRTALKQDEILTKITIKTKENKEGWAYIKLGRRNSAAISRITVAVLRRNSINGNPDTRIALGAVMPIPIRMASVEQILNESEWDELTIRHASEQARVEVGNITGVRWSSPYKLPVVENLVSRALSMARFLR